jgi:hypothetical protein
MDIDSIKAALSPFLADHPFTTIAEIDTESGKRVAVEKPWGDPSLVFVFGEEPQKLIDCLNELILPRRLTAIWHRSSKSLEVIWSAYKPRDQIRDIVGRQFTVRHDSAVYDCHFKRSSDQLLTIAEAFAPVAAPETGFRNLMSYKSYLHYIAHQSASDDTPIDIFGEPVSLWISPLDWSEDAVYQLVPLLNFYMTYFDSLSPRIIVHAPDEKAITPRTRFVTGSFPVEISATGIDNNLLHFWEAAKEGDAARQFVYYYRIIEYASFSYLEGPTRLAVRKLLAAPDAASRVAALVDEIVAVVLSSKNYDDYARLQALIKETCDPKLVWREMKLNFDAFTNEVIFDGGYVVPQTTTSSATEEDFAKVGIDKFCTNVRNIRDALSHGRDQKTTSVIAPTAANFDRLRPWVPVLGTVAAQTMLMTRVL